MRRRRPECSAGLSDANSDTCCSPCYNLRFNHLAHTVDSASDQYGWTEHQFPGGRSVSNFAGFVISEQPIRVGTGGTVVAAVPLYIDPSTNQITQSAVSLVLIQGENSSAAVTVTIQEFPT